MTSQILDVLAVKGHFILESGHHGDLLEGAFVGLMAALHLGVDFIYTERQARSTEEGLFPFGYRIPAPLLSYVRGKRVAIVNDVINAGSAIRGTFFDLQDCGRLNTWKSCRTICGSAQNVLSAPRGFR
jgi:orotate phosphoribosyltransferase